eukprot:7179867-Prymnesium_polylepis.2
MPRGVMWDHTWGHTGSRGVAWSHGGGHLLDARHEQTLEVGGGRVIDLARRVATATPPNLDHELVHHLGECAQALERGAVLGLLLDKGARGHVGHMITCRIRRATCHTRHATCRIRQEARHGMVAQMV